MCLNKSLKYENQDSVISFYCLRSKIQLSLKNTVFSTQNSAKRKIRKNRFQQKRKILLSVLLRAKFSAISCHFASDSGSNSLPKSNKTNYLIFKQYSKILKAFLIKNKWKNYEFKINHYLKQHNFLYRQSNSERFSASSSCQPETLPNGNPSAKLKINDSATN